MRGFIRTIACAVAAVATLSIALFVGSGTAQASDHTSAVPAHVSTAQLGSNCEQLFPGGKICTNDESATYLAIQPYLPRYVDTVRQHRMTKPAPSDNAIAATAVLVCTGSDYWNVDPRDFPAKVQGDSADFGSLTPQNAAAAALAAHQTFCPVAPTNE